MRRSTLTELANNPDLISGIYNYCDRWCERCPLTSRCLVYATEQEDNDVFESNDVRNEAFWKKLNAIFLETHEMINEWARSAGVNLSDVCEETENGHKRKRQLVDNHPLTRAGKKYANSASDWFREFDQCDCENTTLEDAREVIQWYQYQIAVKTIRALSGRKEELEEDLPKDSDGSAKVAMIGVERSIAAWRMMQLSLPEREESIVPLILQLEKLRRRLENGFPEARAFIRPGFD
ncbi:MAG TPA: hypothetical protein VFI24_24240 [Pyrinomonadaceae bacterium]|nr:hypothetical protein [Pyrinomonadaceae bacterium]